MGQEVGQESKLNGEATGGRGSSFLSLPPLINARLTQSVSIDLIIHNNNTYDNTGVGHQRRGKAQRTGQERKRLRARQQAAAAAAAAVASMAGKGFNQWSTARRLVLVAIMLMMEVRGCAWGGGDHCLGKAGWTGAHASSSSI